MDESTDVGSDKQCTFSVVFIDCETSKMINEFLHKTECPNGDA